MSSAILDAQRRVGEITSQAGRAFLHSQFPDEFEYYMCGIEIVDANDSNNVLDFITFPILPENIRIDDNKIQNVTKTSNGVVVLENFSFVPKTISISGNFGRRFKLVSGSGETFPAVITSDKVTDVFENITNKSIQLPEFSISAKNGYGMTKVLEKIFKKSSSIRNGAPVQMFFYCQAFNANYLVQPINIQFSQNRSTTNMIWEYSMTLKALAPADELISKEKDDRLLETYLKEDVIKSAASSIIEFARSEKKLLSSKLMFATGKVIGLK